ncbi:MAG: helix-turn-helix domain-containing protein [Comamonas sp.]
MPEKSPPLVAVMAFDRISPFHLSVPCMVLGEDRALSQQPWFALRVCAAEPGPLRSSAGFGLECAYGLEALAEADIVIVPSWRDVAESPPQALLDALRTAHGRGACVVGLCLGAYVLAAAGLLSGHEATTHWAWAEDFAQRYPDVDLHPDALYVQAPGVWTSAGVVAGIDCCLHLVREWYGHEVANKLARRLVMPAYREGMQAQFIEQPVPKRLPDRRMAALLDSLRDDLQSTHSIDAVAERLAVSRRSLTRQFKRLTGLTLREWLLNERLRMACNRLEGTSQSIEAIASECGFGTGTSLRQHFAQRFKTTPSAYRRMFRRT